MTNIRVGSIYDPKDIVCGKCKYEEKHKILDYTINEVRIECMSCGYKVWVDKSLFISCFTLGATKNINASVADKCSCKSYTLFNFGCQCGAFQREYKAKYGIEP